MIQFEIKRVTKCMKVESKVNLSLKTWTGNLELDQNEVIESIGSYDSNSYGSS